MNYRQSVTLALLILLAFTVVCWIAVSEHRPVQAQSVQDTRMGLEVAPYKQIFPTEGSIKRCTKDANSTLSKVIYPCRCHSNTR